MWDHMLAKYGLLDKYPSIPRSLRHGFDAGIPKIRSTNTPANGPSIHVHTQQYQEILDREFESGRYIGPLSKDEVEELIGPFQSSPLSLVPKPSKPGKYRAVHNFSFPHSPQGSFTSINYLIDSNLFPCTWGTFATLCTVIWHLPPGSQASVRDVAEAYRTVPITADQWPGLVVKLRDADQFAINTNNNFGLSSAGGIHGSVADAAADIFRASGIGPLSKWVDDHVFFRILREHLPSYNDKRKEWHRQITANGGRLQERSRFWFQGETMPDGRPMEFDEDAGVSFRDLSSNSPRTPEDATFTYNDADIDYVSSLLGIPWENTKTIPFGHSFPYLGFSWDLQARTVTIPPTKKEKYSDAIAKWAASPTHTLEEVRKLYGKLLHASLVVPAGRAYLTNLESMLSTFNNRPLVPHHAPRDTSQDLRWWTATLNLPHLFRKIPGPHKLIDIEAYSDASSGCGIAITIGRRWRAWRLVPGWKSDGRDIGWAEAVGFEFLVQAVLATAAPGDHFKLYGDNRGVVEGWWKGRSKNKQTNSVFRRIHEVSNARQCTVHSRYVPSKDNPADGPSRGIYPPSRLLLPVTIIPVEISGFVTDFDSKLLPAELDARRRGIVPSPTPKPARERLEPKEDYLLFNEYEFPNAHDQTEG